MSSRQNRARKLLEQGLQHHRAGNLEAADLAYLQASDADPRNPDALNLRGAVALTTGKLPLAVSLFRKATALQPGNPGLWGNLGNALFECADYAASEQAYRRAARLTADNPDFAIGIGNALAAAGQADEAQKIFGTVAERRPDRATAWFGLAMLATNAGQTEKALDLYRRALQADPHYGHAHLNLGVALQSQERMEEAEQCYRHALAFGAPREITYVNLISVLSTMAKFEAIDPVARAAIAEFPGSLELHKLRSATYAQQGRLADAVAPARQAATLDPHNVAVQLALGGLLFETGFTEQGLAALEQLRVAHPHDRHLAYIVGVTQLLAGHFQAGWRDFAHREVRQTKLQSRPWLTDQLPVDVQGKSIRLIREQGLGDELFFLRFAPLLRSLGPIVTYVTNEKLLSILNRTDCANRVIAEVSDSEAAPALSLHTNGTEMLIGDLPNALCQHGGAENFSVPPPLALHPLPERMTSMREKLASLGPPPYLALTWRGGTSPHEQAGNSWTLFKNIQPAEFGRAFAGIPFTLLAIQRKPMPGEITQLAKATGAPIHDLCDVNDDLEDMLALLAVVDEYVGVSNTNMHLRAGLNRGARVLVPRPSEWRWLAHGEQSPWFPGFNVYRQGLDGTWHDALEQLHAHLLNTPTGTEPPVIASARADN